MGKIVLWIVIVFAVLVVLRVLNTAKARRKAQAAAAAGKPATAEPMVRCVRCGVYLPRADAKPSAQGLTCGDAKCLESR
jgi:hypothetical protein